MPERLKVVHDPEKVKSALRTNAETDTQWRYHEIAKELYGWTDIFRDTLIDPLARIDRRVLPAPVLGFATLSVRTYADYRLGKNEFGVDDQIRLNVLYLDRPKYSILETTLHEQLHLWQQRLGEHPYKSGRNTHNAEFVAKCESFGLHPAPVYGYHTRPADGLFEELLKTHGILKPQAEEVEKGEKRNYWAVVKPSGRSTLGLWTCSCEPPQRARVGKDDFAAICVRCNTSFKKSE